MSTLTYPYESCTPEQVIETAAHILALRGWVPTDRVLGMVVDLLELVEDESIVIIEGGEERRTGSEEQAAQYALMAVRLISTFDLVITEQEDPNEAAARQALRQQYGDEALLTLSGRAS